MSQSNGGNGAEKPVQRDVAQQMDADLTPLKDLVRIAIETDKELLKTLGQMDKTGK